MKKQWIKNADFNYSFWVNEKKIGEMEITHNSVDSKAICRIEEKEFVIKRTGFWKSSIEITDSNGNSIAKTYFEKWYANSLVLECGNQKYKLIVHNNPLAEYAIMDNNKTIIAYGLNADNGKINVKITTENKTTDFLFDFLLWYLFVPVATENMGDNITFHMLLTT